MEKLSWPSIWVAVSISAIVSSFMFFDLKTDMNNLREDIRENRELIIKYIAKDPKLSSASP